MPSLNRENRAHGLMLASDSEMSLAYASILARHEVVVRAVVLEPDTSEEMATTIAERFPVPPPVVFTSRPDKDPVILQLVNSGSIDLLFCCWFKYRVRPKLLNSLNIGAVNIHPSALPYNKSRHSAFWGIMNGTPLGATIHWMDESFDTGDIIAQATFEDDGVMSAEEVYGRQLSLCLELFDQHLPSTLIDNPPRINQPAGGSYHFERDIRNATTFDGSDSITMEKLLRLARGTRMGSNGFYVQIGDRKFKVQASVSEVIE